MVNYIIQRLKGMMEINKLIKRIYDKNLKIFLKYNNFNLKKNNFKKNVNTII